MERISAYARLISNVSSFTSEWESVELTFGPSSFGDRTRMVALLLSCHSGISLEDPPTSAPE